MGRNNKMREITGRIEDRRGYYQMVINAGYLENGKRNRINLTTGLPILRNSKKATSMLRETISLLADAMKLTGIIDLKELHKFITEQDVDAVDKPSSRQNEAVNSHIKQFLSLFSFVPLKYLF